MKPFKKITFPNGLRLILVPRPSSVAASVLILVEAGSEYETKKMNGLSHFLEHMTFKGTAHRPRPGMIAEELAALGAQSNAFTTGEFTGYWAKVAAPKFAKVMDIVADLYLDPLFAPAEIEKERGVVIEEMNMYEDLPMRRVHDLFGQLLYGDQPAGWKVDGEKEIVRKLAREDFLAYRTARYVARATVVIVAGRFDEAAAVRQVRAAFGGLPQRAVPAKTRTRERQAAPRALLQFKESDQGHFVLGFRAFNLFDERRYALQVLADILGGGMSSRLYKRVREEMGAAYYVYASADLSLDHGFLATPVGAERTKIQPVIRTVLEECVRLRDELVPPGELQRSKDHLTGSLLLGLETSDELASFFGEQEILARKPLRAEAIVGKINGITAADVRAVARDIFKEKKLNLAIIGPYRDTAAFKKILAL